MIQRYGIYNPYTRRGAIEGLLPHGPHNVRDVLASEISIYMQWDVVPPMQATQNV